jgi:hypothetical protein
MREGLEGSRSLPLYGSGGFGDDIEGYAVHAGNLVDDAVGD